MRKGRSGWIVRTCGCLAWMAAVVGPGTATAQVGYLGTKFTFQGQLKFNGAPANGPYDFQFKLVKILGIQVGPILTVDDLQVSNGLFTVVLDFGEQFNSEQRWLDIRVRPGASAGAYTRLLPELELTATPFALYSLKAGSTLDDAYDATPAGQQRIINVDNAPIRLQISNSVGTGMILDGPASGNTRQLSLYALTSGDLINAWNDGAGNAGVFQARTGSAGKFTGLGSNSSANCVEISTNGNADSQAILATHTGLGDCGLFQITNASNLGEAVEARTNGGGDAVQAVNTGTGRAGLFQIDNAANTNTALYCLTNGTGLALRTQGKVGIGTATVPSGVLMAVNGKVLCEELEVQLSQDWPDYVFDEDYQLMPLSQVEEHVKEKGHLPGVPSAAEVKSKGLAVGEMQARLLEKIEELTLHMIEQNKRLDEITRENERLRDRLAAVENLRN